MTIKELTFDQYSHLFGGFEPHVFATASFNRLNVAKTESVMCLAVFEGERTVAGLIAGNGSDGVIRAPFSAPFNSLTTVRRGDLSELISVYSAIVDHVSMTGASSIELFMPPSIYCRDSDAINAAALQASGFRVEYSDINYHFDTREITESGSYDRLIAKRNLRYLNSVRRRQLLFESGVLPERVYRVIEANRNSKGYDLRMSLDDVLRTIKVVDADFFVLTDVGGTDLAAAMVYHVAEDVVQVIYWGDIPGIAGGDHCMLELASRIFNHYHDLGVSIVDVGPSSKGGIPSPGLCRFKASIGCKATLKTRWKIGLR